MDKNTNKILTDEEFIRLKVEFFNSDYETKEEFFKFKGIDNSEYNKKFDLWNKFKSDKNIPSDIIEIVKKEKVLQCQKIIDQFNSIKNKSAYGYSERDRNIIKAFKNITRSEINLYDKSKNMGNINKDTEMKVFKKENTKKTNTKTKSKTQVNKSKKHLFEDDNTNNGLSINQTDTTGMTQLDRLKEYTKDIQGNFEDTSEGLYEKYKHKLLQDLMIDVSDDSTISVKERLELFKNIKLELGELEKKQQNLSRPHIQVKVILDRGELSKEEQIDIRKQIEKLNKQSTNETVKELEKQDSNVEDNNQKKNFRSTITKYVIMFKQQSEAFLKLTDDSDHSFILYGGGARGGKSYLGILWMTIMMITLPGSTWFLGREVKQHLETTTYQTIRKIYKELGLIEGEKKNFDSGGADYNWNQKNSIIEFYNGSQLYMSALKIEPSDPELDKIGSMELTGFFIEEAQQVDYKAYNILKGRLSNIYSPKYGWSVNGKGLLTCNPGKNWLYGDFYKKNKEGILEPEKYMIQSLLEDNIFLDTAKIKKNYETMDEVSRARLLYGDWDYDSSPLILFKHDFVVSMFKNQTLISKVKLDEIYGDKTRYISIDLSAKGKDKTVILIWEGNKVIGIITEMITDWPELIKKLELLERKYEVKRQNVIVDVGGAGRNFIDYYKGFTQFDGGSMPLEKVDMFGKNLNKDQGSIYGNLRAQCYFELSGEIDNLNILVCETEHKNEMVEELDSIIEKIVGEGNRKYIISKKDIYKVIQRSPDLADALMMKMYFNVKNKLNKPKSGVGKGFRFFNI